MSDTRTVDAGSARDLLLAYLILGSDVDWRSSLFASGCTARQGRWQWTRHAHTLQDVSFDVRRLLLGEREWISLPP